MTEQNSIVNYLNGRIIVIAENQADGKESYPSQSRY